MSTLTDSSKYLEKLALINSNQQQVLSVLKWFNNYYNNCDPDEKKFILKYIDNIVDSAYPRKVLDTLCLLYQYNLYKSQKQLESYIEDILENKNSKELVNILAILNSNKLLTEESVKHLFQQTEANIKLLEKRLLETNNKFIMKNKLLLHAAQADRGSRLAQKTDSLKEIILAFPLKKELLQTSTPNKKQSEDLSLSLTAVSDNKSSHQKISAPQVSPNSTQPPHHESLKPYLQTKLSSTTRKPKASLISRLSKLIKKWRKWIKIYKNKKAIDQQYQVHIKKISKVTDIKELTNILCDIGLLYGKSKNLPKKNPIIDQAIKKFTSTHPLQAEILVWLNSNNDFWNKGSDEINTLRKNLDNTLNFTSHGKALYALLNLLRKQLSEPLTRETKLNLCKPNTPSTTTTTDQTQVKTLEVNKENRLKPKGTTQSPSSVKPKQNKSYFFSPPKTSEKKITAAQKIPTLSTHLLR